MKDFAKIEKETLTYVKPEYKSRDVSQPPSFTLPLNNRKLTVGYTGTISCSVRGHPKPKIRWFKNKSMRILIEQRFHHFQLKLLTTQNTK